VVVCLGPLGEGVEDLFARQRLRDDLQDEGRDAAERHRADRAKRADPDPRRAQLVGVGLAEFADLAVAGDQLDRDDLRGQVAELRAGAVSAGRDRPGHRLDSDVAEVLQRQPESVELVVEIGEHRPGADLDQPGGGIGVDDAAEGADVDHRPVGHRRLGEGMAGAGDADLPARLAGGDDRRRELAAIARRDPLDRPADLISRPVAPLPGHR
jgi:hypothetical protein